MSENRDKAEYLDLEQEILGLFRRALANDALTVDDDFFEAGGDSLLAMEVLLKAEELTGRLLSPTIIFETGTVRELVKKIVMHDDPENSGG
ncbi:MAG TPA: phosphopantetheine-binding protein [Smithella sp.]|nr:phosphopantetheine-binding protein [Smithella sp.]